MATMKREARAKEKERVENNIHWDREKRKPPN
jgi:hypothetical protein